MTKVYSNDNVASNNEIIKTCVRSIDKLSDTVMRLRFDIPDEGYEYYAGQFLTLYNNEGIGRIYCLASVPDLDGFLELQINRTTDGVLMSWIYDLLKPGDAVRISPAFGKCYYVSADLKQPLMLIGTGIALAPLYSILRDVLIKNDHIGPVHLFHRTYYRSDYFLVKQLNQIEKEYSNFSYTQIITERNGPEGLTDMTTIELTVGTIDDLSNWQLYLYGDPDTVREVKTYSMDLGINDDSIFEAAFKMQNY